MKRGEIYYIENYKKEGHLQSGYRPAVIVSNQKQLDTSDNVQIVYMTTQPKKDLPTHFTTRNALSPSTVLCENVYSVPSYKVGALIGELSEQEVQQLNICLCIGLDLAPEGVNDKTAYVDPEKILRMKNDMEETENMAVKAMHEAAVYKELYEDMLNKVLEG